MRYIVHIFIGLILVPTFTLWIVEANTWMELQTLLEHSIMEHPARNRLGLQTLLENSSMKHTARNRLGTTDITKIFHYGTPRQEQVKNYRRY